VLNYKNSIAKTSKYTSTKPYNLLFLLFPRKRESMLFILFFNWPIGKSGNWSIDLLVNWSIGESVNYQISNFANLIHLVCKPFIYNPFNNQHFQNPYKIRLSTDANKRVLRHFFNQGGVFIPFKF
jgi:hypothetical protein